MKPISVAFFIPAFSDGGAQRQCAYLLNALGKRDDVRLTLFYINDGVHAHLIEKHSIDVVKLPFHSYADPRIALSIAGHCRREGIDLIMTWLRSADIQGYFIRLFAPGLKWVLSERNSHHAGRFKPLVRKTLGRHADAIVANSPAGKHYWNRTRVRGNIHVVDNIVQPVRFTRKTGAQSVVLYVGRLKPQKNIKTLIVAFCLLAERRPDTIFEVIGEGSLRADAEREIGARGLQNRVRLRGFRADVPRFMACANVLVSVSHHEGMPNVLLEGISAGVPILASNIPEHTGILGEDYPHLISARNDPAACADAIENALLQGDNALLLETAKARLTGMTAEVVAAKYIELFREVLSE